jgi:DNA polymerase-3 subunit gamma/tau
MSYLVLARKWRPKDFSETVGQEHVLQALTNALESQRLHHAYLFAGTRGVGKTTIARILAKALNCETGITANPCGKCSACLEIDEGRFVDLIEVDAASKTKVDDTRELLDNVQYAPARGRFKVYLIDEVHMLSKSSFNALLKTLEEPPPHVKFLLATTDPQKLPVTVLSRCLQFNLKRLTPKLIRDRLVHICEAENVKAEVPALAMLARAADGSLRDALSLLDQAIAYCGGDVLEDPVGIMLGTIDRQHISALLKLLAAGDAPGLLKAVAEIDEQFPDYARLLDDLSRSLQRIAVFQVVGANGLEDELAEGELAELAESIAAEDVQLFYQTALLGRRDLQLAPDPRSGVEMTLLRMLAFQPQRAGNRRPSERPGSHATARSSDDAESKTAPPPSVEKTAEVPVSVKRQWLDPDWNVVIGELNLTGANKLLASNCAYSHRENNTLHFNLDSRSESLLTKSRQKSLAAAVSDLFGEALQVEISFSASAAATPMQEEARRVDEEMAAARASLESDPNVKALQDMFGAQLNPESIELIQQSSGDTPDEQPTSQE